MYLPGNLVTSVLIKSIETTSPPGGNPMKNVFEGSIGFPGVTTHPKSSIEISDNPESNVLMLKFLELNIIVVDSFVELILLIFFSIEPETGITSVTIKSIQIKILVIFFMIYPPIVIII
jgi:hypothetical protein